MGLGEIAPCLACLIFFVLSPCEKMLQPDIPLFGRLPFESVVEKDWGNLA